MASPVNASLVAPLQTLAAPRMARPPTHRVRDILVITVCTLLRGGEGGQARERCGKSQRAWRPTCLAVPNGMASHDTFGRLFARLNPQRLHKCFVSWPRAVSPLTQGALVPREGQTVQASLARATASSLVPLLSTWCAAHGGLVGGQRKTASKANASTASPDLLHVLAIKGGMRTSAARGCQTAMAGQSQSPGGAALLALKSHHQKADAAVKQPVQQSIEPQLAWRTAEHCFDAFDASHGRRVRRRVWPITNLTALPARAQWPGLPSVLAVESLRMAHQHAPVPSDSRLYLSRLVRSATAWGAMVRQQWDSETT